MTKLSGRKRQETEEGTKESNNPILLLAELKVGICRTNFQIYVRKTYLARKYLQTSVQQQSVHSIVDIKTFWFREKSS